MTVFQRTPGNFQAIGLMILSTAFAAGMHATVKKVSVEIHPFEIFFLRQFVGFLVLLPWFFTVGIWALKTERLGLHITRGMMHTAGGLAWFFALSIAPLAKMTALNLSVALFVVLGAVLFMGEKSDPKRLVVLLFGFAGVLVIVRPGIDIISLGILLVLGSRIFTATGKLIAKALSRTEKSATVVAYTSATMAVLSLIPALMVWQTPNLEQLGWIGLLALFGTLGQLSMVQAYKLGDIGTVEPFSFLRLIWAGLFGFLFFAEVPGFWTMVGAVMIIGAVSYLARMEAGGIKKDTAVQHAATSQ